MNKTEYLSKIIKITSIQILFVFLIFLFLKTNEIYLTTIYFVIFYGILSIPIFIKSILYSFFTITIDYPILEVYFFITPILFLILTSVIFILIAYGKITKNILQKVLWIQIANTLAGLLINIFIFAPYNKSFSSFSMLETTVLSLIAVIPTYFFWKIIFKIFTKRVV